MKQFMEQLSDSLLESARIAGASEWRIFWSIIMPNVKPAWLTLAIFQFQQMWGNTGSLFLRNEELKPLQFSLLQITAGGVARAGVAAAVTFIIAAVPIIFFLVATVQHHGNDDYIGHEGVVGAIRLHRWLPWKL